MRKPLLRYLAPLAIIALCAAAPATPTTAQPYIGGLDLPVPAAIGSWSISLRAYSPSGLVGYALDSTKAATVVHFVADTDGPDSRTATPVTLSPQAITAIQSAVAIAHAADWTSQGRVGNGPQDYLTLTLAWRAPDGTIQHGQAHWNIHQAHAEPADAVTLAHSLGSAFGLLI